MFIVRDLLLPLSLLTAFAAVNVFLTLLLRRYGHPALATVAAEYAAAKPTGDRNKGQPPPAQAPAC